MLSGAKYRDDVVASRPIPIQHSMRGRHAIVLPLCTDLGANQVQAFAAVGMSFWLC